MDEEISYLLGSRRISKALDERKIRKQIFKEKEAISVSIKTINANNQRIQEQVQLYKNELKENFHAFSEEEHELHEKLENIKLEIDKGFLQQNSEQAAIVRELMKVKWNELDRQARETEKENDIVECLICGNKEYRKNLQTKISECVFNGGKLKRYVCTCCGAIFGPTKFSNLTQKEKDEDYYIHYLGFKEGDSTEKELRAFYMLNPRKEGIYLNYGCGSWSKSLQILQQEGYTVYGYEPYAKKANGNPNLITDVVELKKYRFDGIYSNDVIEHLINPVEDFKFMKSLLRDEDSKMSHSTSCYIYKHEETRFHTYFFTGNALEYLCSQTGLSICDSVDDEKDNDFICKVFSAKKFEQHLLPLMYIQGLYEKNEKGIVLYANSLIYGPYITYSSGKIAFGINIEKNGEVELKGRFTTNSGTVLLKEFDLEEGQNSIELVLDKTEIDLEVVICVFKGMVLLKDITQI